MHKDGNPIKLRVKLKEVQAEKDLGVTIDKVLSFKRHVELATSKANRVIGVTRRSFDYLTPAIFVQLFKGLVRPKHLFAPTSLWAHVSLCPRLCMPRKVVFCAHVSLCPKKWYFVPTSLCAHVSICPNLCQWELWVGSLNRPVVKQWLS